MRRQRWRVVATTPYDAVDLLTLVGNASANAHVEQRVLTPFDDVADAAPASPRWVPLARWTARCRELLARAGPATALHSLVGARIDLLPYQLEPALAVISGAGTRVLIADEVGLGKTIQAGAVVAELRARGAIERVLVLTPAGLRDQWAGELRDRFSVDSTIVDVQAACRRAASLPPGVNPWATIPVAIASIDYAKRPEVLPAITAAGWDVVIVDEAHGVAPGTDRHAAVAAIAAATPYVLLLTATPHSGDRAAFQSLCALGAHEDPLLVFRRSRREVALAPRRRIHRLFVRPTTGELRIQRLLTALTHEVRHEHGSAECDAWLAVAVLQKRALSSARSLQLSVERRVAAIGSGDSVPWQQLGLPLDDGRGEHDFEDAAPTWTTPLLRDRERERHLLGALGRAARGAAEAGESKVKALCRLLRRLGARGEPAIVFTEYRDTLEHLRATAAPAAVLLHGGLTREERRAAVEAFRTGRSPVLLATDAGSEGLNLQHACRVVINLELPWTPVRLEQRSGRVDRIGQRRAVHVVHLIGRGTWEVAVLERLRARLTVARFDIGAADPIDGNESVDPGGHVPHGGPVDAPRDDTEAEGSQRFVALACEEHSRLVRARRLVEPLRDTSGIGGSCTLVTTTRKWRARAALGPRALVLLQSAVEDGTGRVAAAHVTGVHVQFDGPLAIPLQLRVRAIVDALRFRAPEQEDAPYLEWLKQSLGAASGFWAARIARDRAVAASLGELRGEELQPGLFDRRAVREREVYDVRREHAIERARRRLAAIERAAVLTVLPTEAALIVLPKQ